MSSRRPVLHVVDGAVGAKVKVTVVDVVTIPWRRVRRARTRRKRKEEQQQAGHRVLHGWKSATAHKNTFVLSIYISVLARHDLRL